MHASINLRLPRRQMTNHFDHAASCFLRAQQQQAQPTFLLTVTTYNLLSSTLSHDTTQQRWCTTLQQDFILFLSVTGCAMNNAIGGGVACWSSRAAGSSGYRLWGPRAYTNITFQGCSRLQMGENWPSVCLCCDCNESKVGWRCSKPWQSCEKRTNSNQSRLKEWWLTNIWCRHSGCSLSKAALLQGRRYIVYFSIIFSQKKWKWMWFIIHLYLILKSKNCFLQILVNRTLPVHVFVHSSEHES
jgi:hypothetical protein